MRLISLRDSFAVLIAACSLNMAAVIAPAHSQDSRTVDSFTREEIQAAVFSFADTWAAQIFEAANKVAERAGTDEARRHTDRFRYYGATAGFDIATHPNAGVNLLDFMVLVSLNRIVWEEYWGPQVYGSAADPMINVLRVMDGEAWDFAGEVMTPIQLQAVREVIRAWRAENPGKKDVHFVRFSDFGELGRKPSLEEAMQPGGLLGPVREAAEAADEIRVWGDRALYMLVRMQELMMLRLEMAMKEVLRTPELSQALQDVSGFRKSSERYADILERFPSQLSKQMQALVTQTVHQVSVERQAAINHLLLGVSQERRLALETMVKDVTQVREESINHLLEGISKERQGLNRHSELLLERAGHEAKSILTRLFVLCAGLLLLYFLLRLMYRYTAAQPSATWFGKTAPALALLTVVVSIVAIVLIYDHYSTRAGISPGARDDLRREAPSPKPAASLQLEAPAHDIRNGGNHSFPGADTLSTLSHVETPPSGGTVVTGYQPGSVSEPASYAALVPGAEDNRDPEPEPFRLNQEVVTLEILFAPGKAEIPRAFQSTLNEVSEIVLNNPEFRIEIGGHADGRGVASANQRLSEVRAMNVAQYLIKQGVASDQLWVLGYGADKPVADNGTVEGRAKNRRVEMRVIR